MKSPITLLAGVVLIIGGLALGATGTLHLVGPSLFQATTTIRVTPPGNPGMYDPVFIKNETERIQSPAVLTNLIADLNLNDVWGKKYNNGQRLSNSNVLQILKVDCQPVRSAELIQIRARSEDPGEAVALANALARNYRLHATPMKWAEVMIAAPATTPSRAVSPNRPLAVMFIGSGVLMAIGGIYCCRDGASLLEA